MGLAFSPDSRWIVTAADDRTIRRWDVATGSQTAILHRFDYWIRGIAVGPDGEKVAVALEDGTARILDASTGAKLWSFPASVYSSPAVANGAMYVGSYDASEYAFAVP